MQRYAFLLVLVALTITSTKPTWGEIVIHTDDFEAGSLSGWQVGIKGTPPTNQAEGGNSGRFLQNVSMAPLPPVVSNSSQVIFNHSPEWTGDYTAAGVASLQVDLNNLGTTPLSMRVAIGNRVSPNDTTWWVTTDPVVLLPGSGWQTHTFGLSSSDLTNYEGGPASLSAVLASVAEIRILHNEQVDFRGSSVVSKLGFDNISAVSLASPSDLNGDGSVDAADAGIMFAAWGGPGSTSPADANGDGFVDAADAGVMFGAWTGDSATLNAGIDTIDDHTVDVQLDPQGAVAIWAVNAPEPSGLGLTVAAAAVMLLLVRP